MALGDLFSEGYIYALDTSAVITLDEKFPLHKPIYHSLWNELTNRCNGGTIKLHRLFFQELEDYEGEVNRPLDWAKKIKRKALLRDSSELFKMSAKVFEDWKATPFIQTPKFRAGKEELDPWLVAMGLAFKHVVVTNESFDVKRFQYRIPSVCASYKTVRCIDPDDFVAELGFSLKQ